MPKLICPVGLQGSGKTTWAKEYMATHNNTYRVNGDEVRAMVYTGKYHRDKEAVAKAVQRASVESLLAGGSNVVWDNLNLSHTAQGDCDSMAARTGAELVWHHMNTPLDQCIENDRKRGCKIGRAIIENTALYYDKIPWYDQKRDVVIVDLDGTLTDCEWRRKLYLDKPKKDWVNFLESCGCDDANIGVLRWVLALQTDVDVIAVSGRGEQYWPQTESALARYGFNPNRIFMRRSHDHRHDWEVKNDILSHIKRKILFAIDDRPSVIEKTWRAHGIKVYDVGGYNEYW